MAQDYHQFKDVTMEPRALVRIGPSTAVIITGEWRDVVTLQISMEESHPDTGFVHLRGAKMRTAAGFLSEIAAVLQFPIWFGENWDAFIAIYNADQLLADATDADRRNLADVMEQCNRYWLDEESDDEDEDEEEADDEGFHLLCQVPPAEVAAFRARWEAAGLTLAEETA